MTHAVETKTGARPHGFTDEQAALRRLADLVAERAPTTELFATTVHELVNVLGVSGASLLRYEPDASVSVLASEGDPGLVVGSRWTVEDSSLAAAVHTSGSAVRVDDLSTVSGIATSACRSVFRSVRADRRRLAQRRRDSVRNPSRRSRRSGRFGGRSAPGSLRTRSTWRMLHPLRQVDQPRRLSHDRHTPDHAR